jgi:hypothetical protein
MGRPQLNWPGNTVFYPVAHPLRLDYTRLMKQLGGHLSRRQRRATKPAFVELIARAVRRPKNL